MQHILILKTKKRTIKILQERERERGEKPMTIFRNACMWLFWDVAIMQDYTEEFREITKGSKSKEALPAGSITLINQRPVGEDLHVKFCLHVTHTRHVLPPAISFYNCRTHTKPRFVSIGHVKTIERSSASTRQLLTRMSQLVARSSKMGFLSQLLALNRLNRINRKFAPRLRSHVIARISA